MKDGSYNFMNIFILQYLKERKKEYSFYSVDGEEWQRGGAEQWRIKDESKVKNIAILTTPTTGLAHRCTTNVQHTATYMHFHCTYSPHTFLGDHPFH